MTQEYKLSWDRSELPVGTAITATPNDTALPTLSAYIEPIMTPPYKWQISIYSNAEQWEPWAILECKCLRGKAFAAIVAKEMLRGVYSRLGHHRRGTANRRAQKEVR